MKEIRLLKLLLRDFQGGTLTLNGGGKDLFIFGANAVGKTRIVSAFSWLLFNKDALGRSDFEIKNLDGDGKAAHGLEHTVEADLLVDGETFNLKKVFKEKWMKKRGNAEREFSGHTTEYFVDGVPLQEKLYIQKITDIAGDESRFRLLTSPMTFPALHWQAQRKLLLEICGDISDNDVILSDHKLGPLVDILGKHTLEDHRKIVTARRSEINKEMEKIPIRIDEVRRGLPDTTAIDRQASEKATQDLETSLNDAKLRLQGVNTGGDIADLTKKLSGLNADLRKMEDVHRLGALATLNRLNQQISEVGVQVGAARRRMQAIDGELRAKDGSVKNADSRLARFREEWTLIDSDTFKDQTDETCLACGQALPPEQIKEARKNYLASFNSKKAERLGEIDRKGRDLKEQRDRLQGEIDALKKELEVFGLEIPSMEHKLKTLTDDRDNLKTSSEDFSSIPHHAEILDEIESLNDEIKTEREGKAQDLTEIREEIEKLQPKLFHAKAQVDKFTAREQGEKRIEELKIIEKQLSKEFEDLENQLYLTDLFIRTKVSLLTDRINAKFPTVRWKLFETLINGGVNEVCEMTIGGIPYSGGLNNAARIQGGLEIVKVLQDHYGLRCPIWLDNRESFTEIPEMPCQTISLIVSPEDKTIRVEIR